MPRETKTFTTPGGLSVELKTYLNAAETNSMKADLLEKMKMNVSELVSGDEVKVHGEIDGTFLQKQEAKLLSLLIISINGVKENIIQVLGELRNGEYQAIIEEVNKIHRGNFPQAK